VLPVTCRGGVSSILSYAYERLSSIPSVGMFLEHVVESSGLSEAASSDEYTFSNSPHYLYTGVSPASAFTFNTLKKVVGQTVQAAAEAVIASFSGIAYGVYQAGKALYSAYQAAAHPYDVVPTGTGVSPTVEGVSFTRLTPICKTYGLNLEAFAGGVKMDLKVAEILMYSGKVVFPSVEDRMPAGFDKIWDDLQLQPMYVRQAQPGSPDSAIRDIITNQAGLVVPSDYWDNDSPYMQITDGDSLSYARHLMGGFIGAYLHYRFDMNFGADHWINNPDVQSAIDDVLWWSPSNWNVVLPKKHPGFDHYPSSPTTLYEFIGQKAFKAPGWDGKTYDIYWNALINALVLCLRNALNKLRSWWGPRVFDWRKKFFLRTIIRYKPVDYREMDSSVRFYNDGSSDIFEFNPEALRSITYTDPSEEEIVFGDSYRKAREILEGIEFYLSEGNDRLKYSGSTFGGERGQNYNNYTWYWVLSGGRVVGMDGVCPFVWAVASASHYNDSDDRVFVPYVTELANFLPSMYRLKTDEENRVLYERLMTGVIITAVVSAAALTFAVLVKRAHRKFSMKAAGQRRAFENTLAATGEWDKGSWRAYKKSARISNLLAALSGGVKEAPVKAFKSMKVSDLLPKKDDPVPFKVDNKPLQDSIETIIGFHEPLQDSIETIIGFHEPLQDSIDDIRGLLK